MPDFNPEGYNRPIEGFPVYPRPGFDTIRIIESDVSHPTAGAQVLARTGDPVLVGSVSGVCLETAEANTDYVNIDTGGIYWLMVTAGDEIGVGDYVYADTDLVLSNDPDGTPFGFALVGVPETDTAIIPVKVVQWVDLIS
jgi:predicted RecA/RadA family phage recombinase